MQTQLGTLPVYTIGRSGQTLHVLNALGVKASHVPGFENLLFFVFGFVGACVEVRVVLPSVA